MRSVPTDKPRILCDQLLRDWKVTKHMDPVRYDLEVPEGYREVDFLVERLVEMCHSYLHFYPEETRVGGAYSHTPKLFSALVASVHNFVSVDKTWHKHKRGSDVQMLLQVLEQFMKIQAELEPAESLRRLHQVMFLYLCFRIEGFSAVAVSKPGDVFYFVERLLMISLRQSMFGTYGKPVPMSFDAAVHMDNGLGKANNGSHRKQYEQRLAVVGGFDFRAAGRESRDALKAMQARYAVLKKLLKNNPLQVSICMTRVVTTGHIMDDAPKTAVESVAGPALSK